MTKALQTAWRRPSSVSPAVSTTSRVPRLGDRFMQWIRGDTSVEYSGFYSLEKLYAFQIDKQPTFWTEQAFIWLASLPAFCVVIGMELLPLQDPSLAWTKNASFYVREFLRVWVGATNVNFQAQEFIPQLQRPLSHLVLLALLQTLPFVGTLWASAQLLGVFPVPFSTLVPLLPTLAVSQALRYVFMRGVLERDPALKTQFRQYEQLTAFSFSLIIIYSAYGFVFRSVESRLQLVLSFVLYVIKQWAKHLMWRLSHIQDHHDLSGESVSCGVHLFHALFTITCLQTAHSYDTFLVLLGLGMLQDLLAFRYLRRISGQVSIVLEELKRDGLMNEANTPYHAQWTAHQIGEAQQSTPLVARAKIFRGVPVMVERTAYFRHHQTASESLQSGVSGNPIISLQPITPHLRRAGATQAVAHLMHCREVVLLRMFVDIFVPLFYLTYCTVMLLLPNNNRHYLETLRGMNWVSWSTLYTSVSILVTTKIITLGALCWLFHLYKQPPGVHQLVFVMRSQRRTMQAWFILNFLQLTDFSLAHMGNDLSFQFTWVHQKP